MDAPAAPILQRVDAEAHVSAKRRGGDTVLDGLRQRGSAKIHLPRTDGFEAVSVNTAGGLTGGDRFGLSVGAGPETRMTLATQTAERLYRSAGGEATVTNTLDIGAGARLDWLPQETIMFEGARLRRSLTVHMPEDAVLLAVEPLVLGRAAMGEAVTRGFLHDQWRIWRGETLVYADALRLGGDIASTLAAQATFGGRIACASLLYVAPDAQDRVDTVRAALGGDGAASAWNGLLAARIIADTGAALRRTIEDVTKTLRDGPLPRVWSI
jgi:urease accessory protein